MKVFFTYLYGMSILFLLYVFCFLLQESACCAKSESPTRPKQLKQPKKSKTEKKDKKTDKKDPKNGKSKKDLQDSTDVEAGVTTRVLQRRKTSQNDHSYGSFFLRIGAIVFGLGTMVYNGLEFGAFFEIPPTSPCYQILHGVNPILQMVFTFMQMYFVFMNARLNIHRFKVIARFGLMHVVATNICVWVRTLVFESLKEITQIGQKIGKQELGIIESIRQHALNNAGTILGLAPRDMSQLHLGGGDLFGPRSTTSATTRKIVKTTISTVGRYARSTARSVARAITVVPTSKTTVAPFISTTTTPVTTTIKSFPTTTERSFSLNISTMMDAITNAVEYSFSTLKSSNLSTKTLTSIHPLKPTSSSDPLFWDFANAPQKKIENTIPQIFDLAKSTNITGAWSPIFEFYHSSQPADNACGRVNIMGNIVQEAAPYLFPFIIEYSLIGAAVIYVMWKHIGRYPHWPHQVEADLERRLEAMLSRRAVALAHAGHGRVDCIGASKGLFLGLFLLVGSLICLILFFVLIHHPSFGLLAIYLADVSHCALMVLSIFAIIIGFIRVKNLKFKAEEQSDLNDILLRVSAFGLFLYAVFSVIAGSLAAFTHEPNLLVMVTGALAIFQVVLQMLFIADVSRRRVHLPEHDRSKPGRQVITFLLICNVTMWVIYTFENRKVADNPVQLDFYGYLAWTLIQRVTLPLCIFHRFHSAVTLAEIWKTSYKARLE